MHRAFPKPSDRELLPLLQERGQTLLYSVSVCPHLQSCCPFQDRWFNVPSGPHGGLFVSHRDCLGSEGLGS